MKIDPRLKKYAPKWFARITNATRTAQLRMDVKSGRKTLGINSFSCCIVGESHKWKLPSKSCTYCHSYGMSLYDCVMVCKGDFKRKITEFCDHLEQNHRSLRK